MTFFTTKLDTFKGIGPKRAAAFRKLGITTVRELLRHFPRGYEDWSAPVKIADAPEGQPCCIRGHILSPIAESMPRPGLTLYKFTVSDGANGMQVTLFNTKFLAQQLRRGGEYLFLGTVTNGWHRFEMASPQIEAVDNVRIRPIYPLTEGLSSRIIESTVSEAIRQLGPALDEDPLPEELRRRHSLCSMREALTNIHFPENMAAAKTARDRLIFEELLLLGLGLLGLKGRTRAATGVRLTADYTEEYLPLLPFTLTVAQRRAIGECLRDMLRGDHPMSRLVQGDVGSGKTAVAAGVAYSLIRNGWQAAMMAPTEILAEQHHRSLSKLLEPAGIPVALLTGSLPAARKREILAGLADGSLPFAVGTHALISEGVIFRNLGLVVTDEQHRFGVNQRAALAGKGQHPHTLVMSATPIPRTLALIVYGDLD
ncbi:MAG: DEAD/DEAH box helicase, partial [Oscillospiraceae bacterium]|nr:DEAD/DEAH box helicase [Oscillospiraceae bacterium]